MDKIKMLVEVLAKDIIKTHTIKRLDITISNLILNESVTLNALLISEQDELIESRNITLEGEDYALWSSEDDYVISKVCQLLDLVRS